jgi:hypothetical protein
LQTHVVFSAFGSASEFALLKSLQSFSDFNVICLTSKKNKAGWEMYGITTYCTFLNPMSFFSRSFRFLIRNLTWFPLVTILRKLVFSNYHLRNLFVVPHNLRHFLSLEVLLRLNPEDYVFLVDGRDLIFQVPPSEISKRLITLNKIQLFDEGDFYFNDGAAQDFLSSSTNRDWLKKLYNGKKEFNSFQLKSKIINSGCISGKAKDLVTLLTETTILISKSNFGIYALLDQAALNAVAYQNNDIKSIVNINKNGEIVLNMCGIIESSVEVLNGKIKLEKFVMPIVHQFDRFGHYSSEDGLVLNRRIYALQKD